MDFEALSLKDLLDIMNLLKFLDLEVFSEVEEFTKKKESINSSYLFLEYLGWVLFINYLEIFHFDMIW